MRRLLLSAAYYALYCLAVAIGLSVLVACAVLSAVAGPAPRFRPRPAPEPSPGEWVLTWGGTKAPWTLHGDGSHRQLWFGTDYRGTWHWDAATRTLRVQETRDGVTWQAWAVRLDDRLAGEAEYGTHRPAVSLARKPKP